MFWKKKINTGNKKISYNTADLYAACPGAAVNRSHYRAAVDTFFSSAQQSPPSRLH
jgi:hypothetical protein